MLNQPKERNLLEETSFPVADLPLRLPPGRGGRPIHPGTVLRWIRRGVRGLRLEAVRLGGRWLTSEEAVERFLCHLNNGGDVPGPGNPHAGMRPSGNGNERPAGGEGFPPPVFGAHAG